MTPTTTKRCSGPCREVKPLTDFVRNRSKPGGYASYCRECSNARQRERHAKRKADGIPQDKPRIAAPPKHECVFVQYPGMAKPICFKCFFWAQKQKRSGLFVTDERTRDRTRNNARARVRG